MADKKFRAGVLFGDEVKEVLDYAKANAFALPAVNCIGTSSVNAALAAGREVNSPMIIQYSNGGAQFFIGKGVKGDNQLGQRRFGRRARGELADDDPIFQRRSPFLHRQGHQQG